MFCFLSWPLQGLPCFPLTGYAYTEETFFRPDGKPLNRIVLTELPIKGCDRRLDVGVGIKVSSGPSIFLLRKEFFSVSRTHVIPNGPSFDDVLTHETICIDNEEYDIFLNENPNEIFCLAVPVGIEASYAFRVVENSCMLKICVVGSPWCMHVAQNVLVTKLEVALEHFSGGGRLLWVGGCGGVWAGYFRSKNEQHNVYDFSTTGNAESVVIKRYLHTCRYDDLVDIPSNSYHHNTGTDNHNDHGKGSNNADAGNTSNGTYDISNASNGTNFSDTSITSSLSSNSVLPSLGPTQFSRMRSNVWRSESYCVERYASDVIEMALQGQPITSTNLTEGFTQKENLVCEVELMAHIARVIPNHGDYFSTLRGFGVSSTDLYVLTTELDSANLAMIMENHELTFTENEVKAIVERLLQAVDLLHSRRIAHWDIKPENTVFRIKSSVNNKTERADLQTKLRATSAVPAGKRLTKEEVAKLEAMLIDFGQAVWALPQTNMTTTSKQGDFEAEGAPMSVDSGDVDGSFSAAPQSPSAAVPPTALEPEQASPNSVQTVGNISPFPSFASLPAPVTSVADNPIILGETTAPWWRALAADRDPPGNAHSMTPEHSDFKRAEREAKRSLRQGHAGPALPLRDFEPQKVDVWQIGLLMYLLLTDELLLDLDVSVSGREVFFEDPRCVEKAFVKTGARVSPPCSALLFELLRLDPSSRIEVHAALQHEWFKS